MGVGLHLIQITLVANTLSTLWATSCFTQYELRLRLAFSKGYSTNARGNQKGRALKRAVRGQWRGLVLWPLPRPRIT